MANDIYTTTLHGLAELVSPRVAEGMLARALRAVGTTPEVVDADTMSRLLRGRVRRELERSLPRQGLRRSLADLDRRLARSAAGPGGPDASEFDGESDASAGRTPVGRAGRDAPPAASPGTPTAPHGDAREAEAPPTDDPRTDAPRADGPRAVPIRHAGATRTVEWRREPADAADRATRAAAFPIAEDRTEAARESAGGPPAANGDARQDGSGTTTAAAWAGAPASSATSAHGTPGTTAAGGRPLPVTVTERLADTAGLRQWVWAVRGADVHGGGDGPAPAHVARNVRAALALLARHGHVASLHVRHETGHVLVGMADDDLLVVAGDEGLNLGAIYTTFRALEETP